MEGPISFWGYKEQESNLIPPEHDDDDKFLKYLLSNNYRKYGDLSFSFLLGINFILRTFNTCNIMRYVCHNTLYSCRTTSIYSPKNITFFPWPGVKWFSRISTDIRLKGICLTQCDINKYCNIYPTRCKVTQFILSENCSTCFGWYHHQISRAQTTVSTASGICHTVTAICRYRGRGGTGLSVLCVA
jgi:hypothetical protein